MTTVSIGGASREYVRIEVHGYERPPVGEFHDVNWLTVRVSVSAGAFSGAFDAAFLTEELVAFLEQLKRLHSSLSGEAVFSTLEEQLSLRLIGDGRGHIALTGACVDIAGTGNRLEFSLALDQTHLSSAIQQLNELVRSFPVRAG